jgi:biopolymer transport protein ExbD
MPTKKQWINICIYYLVLIVLFVITAHFFTNSFMIPLSNQASKESYDKCIASVKDDEWCSKQVFIKHGKVVK